LKVLCFYTTHFSYSPAVKNLDDVADHHLGNTFSNAIVAFIHVEETDEVFDAASREKKLTNHLKWVARKNNTKSIVLHSFAHLANTKASAEFTQNIFTASEQRLVNGGYEVWQTPFGYFLDLKMDAPGFSMARIWADL
jgi:hypothetical protein